MFERAHEGKETSSQLGEAIAELANEIAPRIPYAVDPLEIAAVLESQGVTDAVARERFGADSTFDLAQTVFALLHSAPSAHRYQLPTAYLGPETPPWKDYLHGVGLMIGYAIVLLVIRYYGTVGNLGAELVLALSLGITSAMFLANGFSYALSRRTSVYMGLGQRPAAIHFLRRTIKRVIITVGGATMGGALLVAGFMPELIPQSSVFLIAFGMWAIIAVIVTGLSLMQASQWFVISLALGAIVGVDGDQLLAPFTAAHLQIGTSCGLAMTFAILWLGQKRAFAPLPASVPQLIRLPSVAYMLYEAAPYFIYGLVSMLFILMPRLLGWLSWSGQGPERLQLIYDFEVGLTLSAPPLILSNGVLERILRLFWREIATMQATYSGLLPKQFGVQATAFYRRQLVRYYAILALFSLAVAGLFEYARRNDGLTQWLATPNPQTVSFAFYSALLIYGVVGWGLFNGMFCLTLARPVIMVKAMLSGVTALALVSVAIGPQQHLDSVLVAFMVGALVLAATSTWSTYRLLRSADYYYYVLG